MIELKALTKPLEVKVNLGKDEFSINFKQPTYAEVNELIRKSSEENGDNKFFKELNKHFISFSDEIVVKDEEGKKIEFNNLVEFLELPLPYAVRKVIEATIIATVSKDIISAESLEKKS